MQFTIENYENNKKSFHDFDERKEFDGGLTYLIDFNPDNENKARNKFLSVVFSSLLILMIL